MFAFNLPLSILMMSILLDNGCTFMVNSCKSSRDCSTLEYCDTSHVCHCKEGFVQHYGRINKCVEIRNPNQACQYDVQCHQNLKLGLICENHTCRCPKNFVPTNGRCPSIASMFHSPINSLSQVPRRSSGFYSKTLLIIGLVTLFAVILVLTCAFLKFVFRSTKNVTNIETANATIADDASSITSESTRTFSRRSRPPSYSSLPPPSYEDVARNLVPAGVAAWWKGLGTVAETESEGQKTVNEESSHSTVENRESLPCCSSSILDPGTKYGTNSSAPTAPLLSCSVETSSDAQTDKMIQDTN